MIQIVSPKDWKTTPMPEGYRVALLNKDLPASDYQVLLKGFRPRDMDDRWFIYVLDNWIYLHRSWTGYCIFRIKIEEHHGNYCLTELHINGDPEQYKSQDTSYIIDTVSKVLDFVVFNR